MALAGSGARGLVVQGQQSLASAVWSARLRLYKPGQLCISGTTSAEGMGRMSKPGQGHGCVSVEPSVLWHRLLCAKAAAAVD
jgi:hypothetical protein